MRLNLLFLALLLTIVSGPAPAQGPPPATVRVAVAEMKSLAPVTLVPGTVISRDDARLAAEVEGQLITVAEVGDAFEKGEIVARIEDTRLTLLHDQLKAEITQAEARLKFLESEEKRFATLAQSNLAATTQLEATQADRDVALGTLAVARARLAQNQDALERTRILAPFAGVVVERVKMPGERVAEGDDVLRLVNQDRLEVVARAPLEYYRFTRPGQLLELRAGRQTAMGEVRTVVAVGDADTHQFEVRLDIDSDVFPVGQTLRVAVHTDDNREVLAVPRDALVLRPEGQSVFIIDSGNQAQKIEVTTGVGNGELIEVLGEVSPGDKVVIRGNERLQPGQAVSIIDS